MKKLLTLLSLGLGASITVASVQAESSYPDRPISIVVPFAPGGATDTTARQVAEQMSKETGYNVIVDNKPGAGGAVGAGSVARAKPDGYTVLFAVNTEGVIDAMYPDPTDVSTKKFDPIGHIAENAVVLLAGADFPADNLEDAVKLIKANPGKYSYASPGVGTVHQLAVERLKASLGLDILHVPYKGAGPAMIDLVAGTVPLMIGGIAPAKGFLESGQVKLLAVANDRRFKNIPEGTQYFTDVAPDAAVSSWMGLAAPAGTPPERIAVLSKALEKTLDNKQLEESLEKLGMQTDYIAPEPFGELIAKGLVMWNKAAADQKQKSH